MPDEPTKRYRPMPFTRLVNVGHHDFHHYADCNHPDEKYMKLAMDERKAQRSASAIPHSNKSAKLSVHGIFLSYVSHMHFWHKLCIYI